MSSENEPIATLTSGAYKAEVYTCALPSEFIIRFVDGSGTVLEQIDMTGVSTYRQRESEIMDRLRILESGAKPPEPTDLAAAGEY